MYARAIAFLSGYFCEPMHMCCLTFAKVIDGSNPEFTRTLRQVLRLDPDPYLGHKTASGFEDLNEFGQIIPVNFGIMGVQMLSHLRHIASEGILAVDPENIHLYQSNANCRTQR